MGAFQFGEALLDRVQLAPQESLFIPEGLSLIRRGAIRRGPAIAERAGAITPTAAAPTAKATAAPGAPATPAEAATAVGAETPAQIGSTGTPTPTGAGPGSEGSCSIKTWHFHDLHSFFQ